MRSFTGGVAVAAICALLLVAAMQAPGARAGALRAGQAGQWATLDGSLDEFLGPGSANGYEGADGKGGGGGVESVPKHDHWALIAAGSNGWTNYRHQADACHAYHTLKRSGFRDDRIIVMRFDDIAHSPKNPIPGSVINDAACVPDRKDDAGDWQLPKTECDVEIGCGKDYYGAAVNPELFLAALTGNATLAQQRCDALNANETVFGGCNARVVESGPDDHVFLYFADHGNTHLIAFPTKGQWPNEVLTANYLIDALQDMHNRQRFKSAVIYLEACHSGSMFNGLVPPELPIWAVTASSPYENALGCYCGEWVGETAMPCLGDTFSVSWLQDMDSHPLERETLLQDFETARGETLNNSQVCTYGDKSIAKEQISSFMGAPDMESREGKTKGGEVESRQTKLSYLERQHGRSSPHYQAEVSRKRKVDAAASDVVSELVMGRPDLVPVLGEGREGEGSRSGNVSACYDDPHPDITATDGEQEINEGAAAENGEGEAEAYFACLNSVLQTFLDCCLGGELNEYVDHVLAHTDTFAALCRADPAIGGEGAGQFWSAASRAAGCGCGARAEPGAFGYVGESAVL